MGWKADPTKPIKLNGAFFTLCAILRFVVASAAEAELGALFLNCKQATIFRLTLEEMGHPQPPTLVHCDNSTAVGIANNSVKKQRSRSMEMRFFWVADAVEAGKFDTSFRQYGWEDIELGVRLKKLGLKLIKCPEAVGYHWHPAFTIDQLPRLVDVEAQRGRMGVVFYQKHPTWQVRLMIQMTWLHVMLWGVLSLGGLLNERSLRPLLTWLISQGKPQLALEIARIFLNWYNVKGVYAAYRDATNSIQANS